MHKNLVLGISEKLDLVYIWWNNLSDNEKLRLQEKYVTKFIFWIVTNEISRVEYIYNLENDF